jgi:hypothetical protein
MSSDDGRAPDGLYVTGTHWHLVEGGEIRGPEVGRFYLFKCYRWMSCSEAAGYGLFRGSPARGEPVCGACLNYAGVGGHVDVGAAEE